MAFCAEHCRVVTSLGYKCGLRDFLKSCSDNDVNVDPNNYCKKMKSKVNTVLNTISKASDSAESDSASDAQG